MGRKAGAQLLHKTLLALSEAFPDAAFLKVDLKAAFQNLERQPAFEAMNAAVPDLAAAVEAWYSEPAHHLWRDAVGHCEYISSSRGFDQGCPLAAAAFCVAQKTVLKPLLVNLKTLDAEARLFSFLDDTYLVVKKPLALLALTALQQALAPLGLQLNQRKTVVFSPSGQQGLPAELSSHCVDSLPALEAHLRPAWRRRCGPGEGHRPLGKALEGSAAPSEGRPLTAGYCLAAAVLRWPCKLVRPSTGTGQRQQRATLRRHAPRLLARACRPPADTGGQN